MSTDPAVLSGPHRAFLATARRAVLVTIASDGRPRPVPICFVVDPDASVLYTPIDDKPKRTADPAALARVQDLVGDPRVTILVDHWDEDWSRLGWLRADGAAALVAPSEPGHATRIAALRDKYPQYQTHALETRPLIRVEIVRITSWGAIDGAPTD